MEDFSYLVQMQGIPPLHIREVCPKDFYLAQILRTKEASMMPIVRRLVKNKQEFENLPASVFRKFINWTVENVLEENILTVENWLEISFHLCKQRWDQSMDWLETQPMSKIKAMISVLENYVETQNDLMKKG